MSACVMCGAVRHRAVMFHLYGSPEGHYVCGACRALWWAAEERLAQWGDGGTARPCAACGNRARALRRGLCTGCYARERRKTA